MPETKTPNTNNGKKLMTVKGLSEAYGLNEQTVYFWLRYKKFDFFRIRTKILIDPEVFERFLESHLVKGQD